ncbi:MAG: hypothetical protein DRQ42_03190 [Gammaproteobacteria bacterium]|nr:MAG: hypothetical protein DRQ42_03190 [Gammaproteobacteria bacterium]
MATWGHWINTTSNASATSTVNISASGVWHTWLTVDSTTSATSTDTWHKWGNGSATTGGTTGGTTDSSGDTWYYWDNAPNQEVEIKQTGRLFVTDESPTISWQFKSDFLNKHYRKMQTKINRIWNQQLADWLKEEKEAAENKAKTLLLDLISQKEFDLYEKTGKLLVKGRKQSYIVYKTGGVTTILNDQKAKGMCVHLNSADNYKCPDTDNVIAMKMHIEQAEQQFLKTANHHGTRSRYQSEIDFLKVVNE